MELSLAGYSNNFWIKKVDNFNDYRCIIPFTKSLLQYDLLLLIFKQSPSNLEKVIADHFIKTS